MLTLVQWKQTRRVDHLNIVGFHPRHRDGTPHNDLKFFDALVNRFWAATNRFDQITVLGEIIEQVEDFITVGGRPLRYRDAARALGASATAAPVPGTAASGERHQPGTGRQLNPAGRC